jgi:hypothetical protein
MSGPYTTNKGKNVITDRLQTTQATYTNAPKFVAFGGGSGQAQSANVLAAQLGGKTTGTETLVTTSVTNDTYQVVATLTSSGSWGITESGLFTGAASGTANDMFAYSDFAVVNLNASDSIQFTWKVQFT